MNFTNIPHKDKKKTNKIEGSQAGTRLAESSISGTALASHKLLTSTLEKLPRRVLISQVAFFYKAPKTIKKQITKVTVIQSEKNIVSRKMRSAIKKSMRR